MRSWNNIDFGDFDEQELFETHDEFKDRWKKGWENAQMPHYKKSYKTPLEQSLDIMEDYDPSYKEYDDALDYYLNTVDPDIMADGKTKLYEGIVQDLEQNRGGNIFERPLPRGYKVGNQLGGYIQKKIADLVNSKYTWLKKYI